ncbi:metallophosphoesterase [Sinorhizobium sp. RAC02]|uniref:metallophosphoesterase family protein n=1 Tax=Sinorhizobium sp. RAC02 TaxID=1842534 RepID=UPI00083CB2CE|nr:metallophosphoesterase [Sinorhizobium sp. RAC02]AOF94274.1 calcineurin-like phosphoesterase family protein [Sinorhizobium sp. RAC02]
MPAVAVIADAHFHDIEGDYDFAGISLNGRKLTVRTWADTAGSTRVFNESFAALMAALDRVVAKGIRHVVLLGDYTDDGQRETTASLARLLEHYRARHGLSFYATPGNHDVFGPLGKHRDTRYVDASGGTTLVTSDAEKAASDPGQPVVTPKMYCDGVPAGLISMRDFGYFHQPGYLHWETPFGESDDPDLRQHDLVSADGQTVRRLMDASYLVEPEDGLWLLLIDANVFEPRNGKRDIARKKAFLDSSDAGWNALLRVKPYLIDWIADVARRAKEQGKQLLAFSHYPAIDPFEDDTGSERTLFGETNVAKRTPHRQVAETLAKAGIELHFSGHLHVEARSELDIEGRRLTNIAVPSLVAFPAGFVVVETGGKTPVVESVSLSGDPLGADLVALYRAEHYQMGAEPDSVLEAGTYGDFLYRHMHSLTAQRYLPKEWPPEMAARVRGMTLWDLCQLMAGGMAHAVEEHASTFGADTTRLRGCPMLDLVVDWYCLRQSPAQAPGYIPAERLDSYRFLAQTYGDVHAHAPQEPKGFFAIFLGVLGRSLERSSREP